MPPGLMPPGLVVGLAVGVEAVEGDGAAAGDAATVWSELELDGLELFPPPQPETNATKVVPMKRTTNLLMNGLVT